ncbi:MAG: Wzz/FepE/Etk N-terminal domain-containing protein [Candidatus Izemoplasmatales bacterium]
MDEFKQVEAPVEEGITLAELVRIVWNNITIVFLTTLWVTVIGIVYTFVIVNPKYTAETTLMVQVDISATVTSEQSAITIAQNLIATYKAFVVSDKVLNTVIADIPELEGVSPGSLKESISVSTTTSVLIIYIEVVNENPELASRIANQLVDNSIAIANELVDDGTGNLEPAYTLLANKLRTLDVAIVPTAASSPNKVLNVVISFLVGGILSLGIIFVKELFNNKFQSTQDMERYLNINVIAAVPGSIKERKLVD